MSQRAKLPVFKTVAESYSAVLDNLPVLLKIVGGWAVLTTVIRIGLTWSVARLGSSEHVFAAAVLIMFVSGLAVAAVAVSWHRFVLLREVPARSLDVSPALFLRYVLLCLVIFGTICCSWRPLRGWRLQWWGHPRVMCSGC